MNPPLPQVFPVAPNKWLKTEITGPVFSVLEENGDGDTIVYTGAFQEHCGS